MESPLEYRSYGVENIRKGLLNNEGYRKKIYKDSVGKQTVAIGWNIEDNGIPREVADILLDIGIARAEKDLDRKFKRWRLLHSVQQLVLIDMMYNMGYGKFSRFYKMWAALRSGDIPEAAAQMKDSKWYRQVGPRGRRNVKAFRSCILSDFLPPPRKTSRRSK